MEFTWNREKAERNARKHRVTFDSAKSVFADPHLLIDMDETTDEERWNAIGMSSNRLLFVVYDEPDTDTIHMISARRAEKDEQDRYFRQALPQR